MTVAEAPQCGALCYSSSSKVKQPPRMQISELLGFQEGNTQQPLIHLLDSAMGWASRGSGLMEVTDTRIDGWNPVTSAAAEAAVAWVSPEEGQALRRQAKIKSQDSLSTPHYVESLLWARSPGHSKNPAPASQSTQSRDRTGNQGASTGPVRTQTSRGSSLQDGQGRTL